MAEHEIKLRIAVNTRHLIPHKMEGIGRFVQQCFSRIAAWHPEVEFHFLFDRQWDESFVSAPNIVAHKLFPPVRHAYLIRYWYDYKVPRILEKIDADLFISPDNFNSLKTDIPTLTVIHDLNFEYFPEDLPKMYARFYRKFTPKYVEKAVRVMTVSEYSAKDIVDHYKISREKIDVVYSAADDRFHPLGPEVVQHVRNQYALGLPYFLFVGSLHPRKNLANLFRAYAIFRSTSQLEFPLIIAGAKRWWSAETEDCLQSNPFRDQIIFTGSLSDSEMHRIVASAFCLTFVSYFEGFGVPPLEAFACGVPVIVGNRTALPEITADAALHVDPFSPEDIAQSMLRISSDDQLAKTLIQKGFQRVSDFSWDRTAQLIWNSVEKALQIN